MWCLWPWWAALMVDPMPDHEGEVAHLPPPKAGRPPARHVFGPDIRIPREIAPSGFEQIERTCANCGAVKITIVGASEPRAWRRTAEGPQIVSGLAPPCGLNGGWPR